jgi:uncharacterized protein YkwD
LPAAEPAPVGTAPEPPTAPESPASGATIEQSRESVSSSGSSASGSGSSGSSGTSTSTDLATRLFNLANAARSDAGLKPLSRSSAMDTVARNWSLHLASNGLPLAHNPNYSNQIPSGWRAAGENVAWISAASGMSQAQLASRIHNNWMGSAGHRANILNPDFTHLGVGVAHHPDHGHYFTQNFARY